VAAVGAAVAVVVAVVVEAVVAVAPREIVPMVSECFTRRLMELPLISHRQW